MKRMRRLTALALTCFVGFGSASAARAAPGSLVIAGGALRPETAAVWQRIVDLAGGPGASIAVFGSASADPEAAAASAITTLERYGAHAFAVPVAAASKGRDWRTDARDPAIAASVAAARGVFFAGGDQGRITQVLVAPDGTRTPVLDAIWSVFRAGGVIAGTSAGAAIMSSTMFYEPDDELALLQHGLVDGRDVAAGLGFVDPRLFVDQHCLQRGRFARSIEAMRFAGYRQGLCIDEDTAAVVNSNGSVEIVGRSGAVLLDLADAYPATSTSGETARRAFGIRDVRIGLLAPGDRYDIATGSVTPAAGKAPWRKPAGTSRPIGVRPEMLGPHVLEALLTTLVASSRDDAVGLAFDAGVTHAPSIGFEFRFRRTDRTLVHRGDDGPFRGFTIVDAALDITPVMFAAPLYRRSAGSPTRPAP